MKTRWPLDFLDRHLFHIIGAVYLGASVSSILLHDWSSAVGLVPLAIVMLWMNGYRRRGSDEAFRQGWFAGIARYDATLEGHIDEMLRHKLLFTNHKAPLTRKQYADKQRRMEDELAHLECPSVEDVLAVFRKYHR